MERAEDLGLSLSLSSSLAAPRTHVAAMLLRSPGKCTENCYLYVCSLCVGVVVPSYFVQLQLGTLLSS